MKNIGKGLYALKLVEDPTVVVEQVNGAHRKPYQTPPKSPTSSFTGEDGASHNQNNSPPASCDDSIPLPPPPVPSP